MSDLGKTIDGILAERPSGTTWAVSIVDAQTSQPIYEKSADRPFEAYSLGKLVIARALQIETAFNPLLPNHDAVVDRFVKRPGTGFLRYLPEGYSVDIGTAARLMLSESDNTAAKLIVHELRGAEAVNSLIPSKLNLEQTKLVQIDGLRFEFGRTNAGEIARLMIEVLANGADASDALARSHAWYGLRQTISPPNHLGSADQRRFRWARLLHGYGPSGLYAHLVEARRPATPYPSKEGSLESSRHDVALIGQFVVAALSEGYESPIYGPNHPAHQIHGRIGQVLRDYQAA